MLPSCLGAPVSVAFPSRPYGAVSQSQAEPVKIEFMPPIVAIRSWCRTSTYPKT